MRRRLSMERLEHRQMLSGCSYAPVDQFYQSEDHRVVAYRWEDQVIIRLRDG
jgi:hypothetical protein